MVQLNCGEIDRTEKERETEGDHVTVWQLVWSSRRCIVSPPLRPTATIQSATTQPGEGGGDADHGH